jgi:hypothetical protein
VKAERRLALLEQETRAQLLELKELQQQREMLEHRVLELFPTPLISPLPPKPEPLEQEWLAPLPKLEWTARPRQAGKSTMLEQLLAQQESETSTPPK